jgi:putrescine transport system substrate-binding protein
VRRKVFAAATLALSAALTITDGAILSETNSQRRLYGPLKHGYIIPEEGSLLWFDMLAIPRDAPNAANAHLLINYLMDPRVIANISNFIGYANANSAAAPLLNASIASDPAIFPPLDQQQRLFVETEDSPEQSRAITRVWQKFKTAQ